MRWLSFGVLAVVLLALQSTVAPRLELLGVRPDWILGGVVFLGLVMPARDALIAAWLLGFGANLLTLERFGALCLSYTLMAAAVVAGRDHLFRHRAATQFAVTLAASLLLRSVGLVYRRTAFDLEGSLLRECLVEIVLGSLYSAAWAPVIFWAWLRGSRALGFARAHSSAAAAEEVEGSRV